MAIRNMRVWEVKHLKKQKLNAQFQDGFYQTGDLGLGFELGIIKMKC